jgi:hypothetical protein
VASQDKAVAIPYQRTHCGIMRVFNDTTPFTYNADAAALAWSASLGFLAEALTNGSSWRRTP